MRKKLSTIQNTLTNTLSTCCWLRGLPYKSSVVCMQELEQENAKLKVQIQHLQQQLQHQQQQKQTPLPAWFISLKSQPSFIETLYVREWQGDEKGWRNSDEGGWLGNDYVHSSTAGVQVLEYQLHGPRGSSSSSSSSGSGSGTGSDNCLDYTLIGPALFTANAESHKGLCHGGSMCALMDDIVGWLGFCSTGQLRAWEGFTVQIDTSLKKPVKVGSILRVEATISRREGLRKVYIQARLVDPESKVLHCECSGLFLMPPAQSSKS